MTSIKDIIETLEHFAPLPLQEDWDNAGLQIGLTETDASGVLLCLDVTEQVVDEAISKQYNLIVSHHPLLFHGLKQITDADYVQRVVIKAIRNGIAIVSMHTNLDNAVDGVNWKIAEKLGLVNIRFLSNNADTESGSGAIGEFAEPVAAKDFVEKVKQSLECDCVMTNELLARPIRRVALCGGAGAFLLNEAINQKADAFLTGEMHYHEYFGHEQQIQIAVTGHYESEHFTTEIFRDVLKEQYPSLHLEISQTVTNPIRYW